MNRTVKRLIWSGVFFALAFAALGGFRFWIDSGGPAATAAASVVGSTLPASAMVAPLHGGAPRPLSDEIVGTTVVNYFGSWCGPCHAENPALLGLRAEGVRVIGVAVRDQPAATQAFLDELGDPFFRVLNDPEGVSMHAIGIGADVPQTLVIGRDGEVLFRHSGPLVGADGEAALEQIRDLAGPR